MTASNRDLLELFFQLEWHLRRYHLHNYREFGPMGAPHRGQGRILSLLKIKPEISQKELATILDIRSQSLGELLAKLEKAGFITRTPSETDRRGMDIHLTEAGLAASEQPEEPQGLDGMFGCLNEEEQEKMADYLTRLIAYLEKQHDSEESGRDFRSRHDFHDKRSFFDRHFFHHHHSRDE